MKFRNIPEGKIFVETSGLGWHVVNEFEKSGIPFTKFTWEKVKPQPQPKRRMKIEGNPEEYAELL